MSLARGPPAKLRPDMAVSQPPMAVSLDHTLDHTLAVARARVSGSNAGMDWMWP